MVNAGDEVADRCILDMERTVRELAHKNLELEQNFNRRAHELKDTNAQLQARILELEGSRLSRRSDEEADSGVRRRHHPPRPSPRRSHRTSLHLDNIRMASESQENPRNATGSCNQAWVETMVS